jgi:hypothetical protein
MTLEYSYRVPATYPGSTNFTQWVKTYSTQINGELQVESDVAAFGDDSHTSNTIVDVISKLLEARYVYQEDLDKTPLTERDGMIIPHLKDAQFLSLREALFDLKGMLPTISADDPPAFNFDLDVLEGGFDD